MTQPMTDAAPTLRVVTSAEIERLLPMAECIDLMERTMIAVSAGQAVLPLRTLMKLPDQIGMQGIMPGYLATAGLFGTKLISLFPRNAGTAHSSHLGLLALFEDQHGYPVGLMDAAPITAIRTAAASGLATRLLANPDASKLTILGTGEQARRHVEAMLAVRPIDDIRIWGRDLTKAQSFASTLALPEGVAARAVARVQDAVAEAHIVCTTTHAPEPILHGAWIARGTHLNVVGSSIPATAEVDGALVARSRMFVDYRVSALNQAGEYLRAVRDELISPNHILGEIGQVAAREVPGRISPDDVTLYKSLGVAAQDIAAGGYVLRKAGLLGPGQTVSLE